jgi:putative restriction endonuclease
LKLRIYPTDIDWFEFLANRPDIDEVNFWRPGGQVRFTELGIGDLLLFRIRSPINKIAGGGFFLHSSLFPLNAAWDAFGIKNGTSDFQSFFRKIADFKGIRPAEAMPADSQIGCIVLTSPFFLPRSEWVDVPADYPVNSMTGKSYDAGTGVGRELFERMLGLLPKAPAEFHETRKEPVADVFGSPALVKRRIGQGGFRILVTDLYDRRCSVTGEATLPVLEAAHILPVSKGGIHTPENGLLLRSDIHTLFDLGYVTIDNAHKFVVSKTLRDAWSNGRIYYDLQGSTVRLPKKADMRPSSQYLERHNDEVFRG